MFVFTLDPRNSALLFQLLSSFETSNGISHQESGQPKQVDNETPVVSQGSDSYTAPDGQQVSITYIADENGFQVQGSHIPTAPPIPPEIQRALEWNAAHPEEDDGGQPRPPGRGRSFSSAFDPLTLARVYLFVCAPPLCPPNRYSRFTRI